MKVLIVAGLYPVARHSKSNLRATVTFRKSLDALFLVRDDEEGVRGFGVERLFSEVPTAITSAGAN
jgi:hypothetical protein